MRYDSQIEKLKKRGIEGHELNIFQIYCRWLLRYRSEKSISSRVLRWCNEGFTNVASDILRMFVAAHLDENERLINPALRRQMLNAGLTEEIHDALVDELFIRHPENLERINGYNKTKYMFVSYDYRGKELSMEKCVDTYSFILPKNTKELRKWGNVFHNCVASYNLAVIKKESLIFAMKEQDKYIACIEIRQGRIIQALGHCNQKLDIMYRNIIKRWADINNIIYSNFV